MPYVTGGMEFTINFTTGEVSAGSLQGGGSGTRTSLTCGERTFNLVWHQGVTGTFKGAYTTNGSTVELLGQVVIEEAPGFAACLAGVSGDACHHGTAAGPHAYDMRMTGTVNYGSRRASGTWQVDIGGWQTTGDWSVTSP
ncbi:MAG: hypothetical protein FJ029_06295 [Actinobacteria bacterium]|nr:hypothetical protein [Actinomycetota bacterium]